MEGFREYMKTPPYEQGLQRLCEILEHAEGTVALLCFEQHDQDCHRHLIMEDVRRRKPLGT